MIDSIATVSLSGSLGEKLYAIAAAGFRGVEIFENDLVSSDLSPKAVRNLLEELGLFCTAYQPFRDFEGLSGSQREQAFTRAEHKFALMRELGAELMLVCSSVSPHADGDRDRIAADLRELGDRAAAHDLRIGYEALAWGRHVNDHRDAWSVVQAANHPAVGLVLDSFHSLARGIPISSLGDIVCKKLFLVQLADAPRLEMDLLQWSRHFRSMPMQGDLPVTEYVAALMRLGYEGPLSLEIFSDRFRAGPTKTIARDGMRALTRVKEEAARQLGRRTKLPPRTSCDGVAFIEFAANVSEAERLERLFRAMGFKLAGYHRDRSISRWRQGEVNLVLNSTRGGFADHFDVVHGASVCSIGVQVRDSAGAMLRAKAFSVAETGENPVVAMGGIPALRSLGGSLLYLIDRNQAQTLWKEHFEPAGSTRGETGSDAFFILDHIGAVVMRDEFLSWQLYWSAMLEMDKAPAIDLLDPAGVVRSQAMQSPNGCLRITLNDTGPGQTLAARFVSNFFGSGFQHIAFATNDIIQAANRMRSAGLETLPIPQNYYDDLRARYSLSRDRARQLQSLDIMYDVDADGNEFSHFYTRAFEKRFFFEIVQRRGYQGYGAGNTHVRLAAQARYKQPAMFR